MDTLISVSAARTLLRNHISRGLPLRMPLVAAVGLYLAEDVQAGQDIPAFRQSSMDGYAFSYSDWDLKSGFQIGGEVPAGSMETIEVGRGRAVRIFTGAPVPAGADTVVMQEKVRVSGNQLTIEDAALQMGANVRPAGSEIKGGTTALPKGTCLSPAAIGFLAATGTAEVWVYPRPSVCLIITGDELQPPGKDLPFGKVYDSSSYALRAALALAGIGEVSVHWVKDDRVDLTTVLDEAVRRSELVLLTGGVSVGDYDYVVQAAKDCGVSAVFHKVRQRPGKPLYFGRKGDTLVFGLPGNPSSVLTCFYMYVFPFIKGMIGGDAEMLSLKVPLGEPFEKAAGLTHFIKGYFNGTIATPLGAQESYRMYSFARANCLIELEEAHARYETGSLVNIYPLPT